MRSRTPAYEEARRQSEYIAARESAASTGQITSRTSIANTTRTNIRVMFIIKQPSEKRHSLLQIAGSSSDAFTKLLELGYGVIAYP